MFEVYWRLLHEFRLGSRRQQHHLLRTADEIADCLGQALTILVTARAWLECFLRYTPLTAVSA